MTKSSQYVDVLIPSKDRAMQLHLLLESMSRNLSNIGQITVSWTAKNQLHLDSYILLQKRVEEDEIFSRLRSICSNIKWVQRHDMSDYFHVINDTGPSEYILHLCDDDVFIKKCDLRYNEAIEYFFNNPDCIFCSLRLGDNLSHQLCSTDSCLNNSYRADRYKILGTNKPQFEQEYGYQLTEQRKFVKNKFFTYRIHEALNIPHWGCFSLTSTIYRKTNFLSVMNKCSRSFLEFEIYGYKYIQHKVLGSLYLLSKLDRFVDEFVVIFNQVCRSKVKYNYIFSAIAGYIINSKLNAVVPKESVVAAFGQGSLHRDVGFVDLGQSYMSNNVLEYNSYASMELLTPWNVYIGDLKKYD